jgi:DIM1 family U5 snRNP protein
MSYFLPHLPSGWHVDQAILSEEDRVVVIRFGNDWESQCMKMDETLNGVAEKVQNFAVIYLVDITEVPDFNKVGFVSNLNASHEQNATLCDAGADLF